MWTYFPWPSFFLKAWIRKRFRPETFGPTQEYRQSMFHRMSFVYALSAWTAVGCGIYLMMNEDKEKIDEKKEDALPHQEDINKGGALYWINSLKTPEEMQNIQEIKVMKMKGFSYEGVEDVTVAAKEIGQEKHRRQLKLGQDFFLRKHLGIPLESEGGPTNAEIRQKFKEEGKDYELELDLANQINRVKTKYNPDGTVGDFINV